MIVVFLIALFLILLLLAIVFSTLNIRIERLYFSNNHMEKMTFDYLIFFQLSLFKVAKMITIKINPQRVKKIVQKLKLKERMEQVDVKKLKQDLPAKEEQKELIQKLKIKLEEFHLALELGTKNVLMTSAIIAVLSSVLGIVIARGMKQYSEEKYEYKMIPVYQNKNVIKLHLNCIIQVKMVHIICIIFTLVRKRKEKKKHERTSNRRSYDYSYEQY